MAAKITRCVHSDRDVCVAGLIYRYLRIAPDKDFGCKRGNEGVPYSLAHAREAMRPEGGRGKPPKIGSPCWCLRVPLGRPGTGTGCWQAAKTFLASLTCASGTGRRTELALEP
jgi:hypothetical protein